MHRSATSFAIGLGLVAVLITGCGDDDDTTEASGDVDRYCELVAELDEAGSDAFAELEADDAATEADYARTERQFIDDHADEFDELREVAPEAIADDLEVLLTEQEKRASGGDQEETSDEAEAAEERIGEFEEKNCAAGE
jgi:hypothetical protein